MEKEKKDFKKILNRNKNPTVDPAMTLYLKNLEIEKEFLKRFDRTLIVDDFIDNMETETYEC